MRVGIGYDIHRFEPGRRLVVGGVEFESPMGLAGHSDADAALHAIADAILGAAALGDIGDVFPPTDMRWKDADSGVLLREVAGRLPQGWALANVDLCIIAEHPQIAPRRTEMRQRIAELLVLDVNRVSVKATTHERLGALGRTEGLAAIAVVLVQDGETS
jgi:2-C-methyl-D-erythritol 2,4-cyclodiphosphate synthase